MKVPSSTIPAVACDHCGLPVIGTREKSTRPRDHFCCYGCYIAHTITGATGDESLTTLFLARLGVAAFLAMNAMVFSWALYGEALPFLFPVEPEMKRTLAYLVLVFSVPVFFLIGLSYIKNAFAEIASLRPGIDTLIALGTVSAYGVSIVATVRGTNGLYYDTASMILVLVTFGRYLEANAKLKAHEALQAVTTRQVISGRLVTATADKEIDAREIVPGMRLRIHPGEVIPVDGIVLEGSSAVNEALLTGESRPVGKAQGDVVLGGAANYDGWLVIEATSDFSGMTLSQIAAIVEKVHTLRSPSQSKADRLSLFFTPAVVIFGLSVFGVWWGIAGFAEGVLRMLSVLLIACPCALGIGANLALSIGYTRALSNGVLARSFIPLEQLARTTTVVFDKTGTLTEGIASVREIFLSTDWEPRSEEFLRLAASAEQMSEHPFGRAIVAHWKKKFPSSALYPVSEWKAILGDGVSARLTVESGSIRNVEIRSRMDEHENVPALFGISDNKSRSYIYIDGVISGVCTFADNARPFASEVVSGLLPRVKNIELLSGDKRDVVDPLAKMWGIRVFAAEQTPQQKIQRIGDLVRAGENVCMVGDGINDSPALAAASVGIALRSGTQLSRQAAGIVILDDDLRKVTWILDFSRRVSTVIRWNLVWAFGYNVAGIGLAAIGLLHPVFSALAMVASSTMVIVNSSRLSTGGQRSR